MAQLLVCGRAIMDVMTEATLSDRIDDLKGNVDKGFVRVDKEFEKVDKRFDKVDAKFEKVDDRFDRIQGRMTWLVCSLFVGSVVANHVL
jgi:hypothetical protein